MASKFGLNIALLFMLIFLLSCNKSMNNAADYFNYLDNPEHGICKVKDISDLEIKVKYLPAEYLTYQELKNEKQNDINRDSIIEIYQHNITFLVTVGPSKSAENSFDITKVGVSNMEEFKARSMQLNFNMKSAFKLITDSQTLEPVFCEMENVYDLSFHRKFNVVFSPIEDKDELKNTEEFTLVYNDELFNTGISKFKFSKDNINKIPSIGFWKNK